MEEAGPGLGDRDRRGRVASSLIVTALQVFALDVASTVVCAWQLDAILVHAPADPPLPATRGLALLALEKTLSVTVGEIQRQSHDTRGVLHSLNDPIQFSPAGTKLRLMLVDGKRGVVHLTPHGAQLGLCPLAVFTHSLDLPAVDEVFGVKRDFSWWQLVLYGLRCHSVLMFMGLAIYGRMSWFVSLLVCANSSSMEEGVKGLLFSIPWQAAQAMGACSGVHAASLTL